MNDGSAVLTGCCYANSLVVPLHSRRSPAEPARTFSSATSWERGRYLARAPPSLLRDRLPAPAPLCARSTGDGIRMQKPAYTATPRCISSCTHRPWGTPSGRKRKSEDRTLSPPFISATAAEIHKRSRPPRMGPVSRSPLRSRPTRRMNTPPIPQLVRPVARWLRPCPQGGQGPGCRLRSLRGKPATGDPSARRAG